MLLVKLTVDALIALIAPPKSVAELPEMVLLLKLTLDESIALIAPPKFTLVLFERVLLFIFTSELTA